MEQRKRPDEIFCNAVHKYLSGTDFDLRDAVRDVDQSLTLAIEKYLLEEKLKLPERGENEFGRLVDSFMTHFGGDSWYWEKADHLKRRFHGLRNRVTHQGIVPKADDVWEFIDLAALYLNLLGVDISEVKPIVEKIRVQKSLAQPNMNFDQTLTVLIEKLVPTEEHYFRWQLVELVENEEETVVGVLQYIINTISDARINALVEKKDRIPKDTYQKLIRAAKKDIDNIKRRISSLSSMLNSAESKKEIERDTEAIISNELKLDGAFWELERMCRERLLGREDIEELRSIIKEPARLADKVRKLLQTEQKKLSNLLD